MKRHSILVIDADRHFRKQIIWALHEDFELFEAEDRDTAIQYFEKEKRPDVILTELFLSPRPDYLDEGFTVLNKLKEIAPGVKIIVVTTIDRGDIIEKARELWADEYIMKPFELKELKRAIEKFAPLANAKKYELKKEGKMKLRTTYEKQASASIKATIKVIDSGDFPTVNVFKSMSENPLDESWNIGEGTESTISNTLPSPDEAKQWVSAQVNVLKWKLDNWRNIWVPESQEFEI